MAREEIISASHTPRGPSREVHSDDMKIEQKRPIAGDNYDGEIVLTERVINADYAAELAFMEEPVKIRLEPSAEKNAVSAFPVWVNGKGAEVFMNGRWYEIGYLPVGQEITIKRKVLEVVARTKIDTVHTEVRNPESEHPDNRVNRFTSAVHSFSVLHDANPRGIAWLTELRRRNF